MKSPIYPKHESEFDPQLDFAQFLKEAKTHENELTQDAEITTRSSEVAANKQVDEGTKKKKSWKKSLFSWLKADKKSNKPMPDPEEQPSNKLSNISKARRINLSGPINGGATLKTERPRRPNSGPLAGYFKPIKRMEDKVPYVCLDRLNSRRVVQTYGPVYMVS